MASRIRKVQSAPAWTGRVANTTTSQAVYRIPTHSQRCDAVAYEIIGVSPISVYTEGSNIYRISLNTEALQDAIEWMDLDLSNVTLTLGTVAGDATFTGNLNVDGTFTWVQVNAESIDATSIDGDAITSATITSTALTTDTLTVNETSTFTGDATFGNIIAESGINTVDLVVSGDAEIENLEATMATVTWALDAEWGVTVANGLTVTSWDTSVQDLIVAGTSTLTGDVTAWADVSIAGDGSVTGNVTVSGNETIAGTLWVSGDTTLEDLSVTGNETVAGTLGVAWATSLSSTLAVTWVSTFSNDATFGRNVTVTGNETVSWNEIVSGNLTVNWATTMNGVATVEGNFSANSNASVGNNLTVAGTTTLNWATEINNSLEVSGATRVEWAMTVDWWITSNAQIDAPTIRTDEIVADEVRVTTALYLSEWAEADDFVLQTEKGVANWVATLDANGRMPVVQLPEIYTTAIVKIGSGIFDNSDTCIIEDDTITANSYVNISNYTDIIGDVEEIIHPGQITLVSNHTETGSFKYIVVNPLS